MPIGVAGRDEGGGPHRVPWLRLSLLVAVVVAGLAAVVSTWVQETDRVEVAAAADLDRAGSLATAIGTSLDNSLAGVAAVVEPDGTLDETAFESFAQELVTPEGIPALAYEPVVAAADRAAFEARIGRPITDRPGGDVVEAPDRPEHFPVLTVVSTAPGVSEQLIGFDLLGDPVRAAAAYEARDAGATVFSEPVPSEPSGTLSVFVVTPVYRPTAPVETPLQRREALVGFVSTAFAATGIADAMAFVLPPDVPFEVRDGDTLLASGGGSVDGGGARRVAVANRAWTVVVDGGGEPDRGVSILLGVLTVALVGAMAYELVRSSRQERAKERAARRSEELARLAEGLAMLTTTEDVMHFLTTGVLAPLGAMHAAVGVIEGNRLRRHFTPNALTQAAGPLLPDTVPLDADMPLARAARTGDPTLLGSDAELAEHFPDLVAGWRRLGFVATANLPLRDRNGQLLGALGLAWDHPVDFAALRDTLATVAGIAGQTIDRARLSDAEHRLVTDMQGALLTPLPAAEGLEVAERYLPAIADVGMGGDWYEGIALDDRRYLVVVGDVAGHGIAAVAKMAHLRSVIGTIAALGTPLEEVLPRTSARPVDGPVVVASAAIVEVDVAAGRIRYTCAGHPPPLLRLPSGEVVQLDGGRQPLLGIEMSPRPAGEHDFPIGSALVCFTDGLVERRHEGIDESIQRLAEALAASPATAAGALADDLLERCRATAQDDDVAVAVLVHTGLAGAAG